MGYTIEEVNKLMPWLSALPFQTPININTASVEILNSLSGNYGPAFIEAVLSGRPFSNVNDFYNQINEYLALWDPIKPGVGRANLIWPQHLISVNSDFFKLYLEAEIGEAKMELTSLLHRTKNAGINIISRDIRLVPKILPSSKPMSEIEALFSKKDEVSKTDQQNLQETNIIQSACSMMEFK
jgi:type II secretory pathway component PulK